MRPDNFDTCSLTDTIVKVDSQKWIDVFIPQMVRKAPTKSVSKGVI